MLHWVTGTLAFLFPRISNAILDYAECIYKHDFDLAR